MRLSIRENPNGGESDKMRMADASASALNQTGPPNGFNMPFARVNGRRYLPSLLADYCSGACAPPPA